MNGRRRVIIACFVVALGGSVGGMRLVVSLRSLPVDIHSLPLVINGMKGRDVESEGLEKYFDRDEYVNRVYTDGRRTVYFHMAKPKAPTSGQHYPSSCVPGHGDRIVEREDVTLSLAGKLIHAQRLITAKGDLIYFWFSNGRRTWTKRTLGVWIALALDNSWQSVKYLIETKIPDGGVAEADRLIEDFLRHLPAEFILGGSPVAGKATVRN